MDLEGIKIEQWEPIDEVFRKGNNLKNRNLRVV